MSNRRHSPRRLRTPFIEQWPQRQSDGSAQRPDEPVIGEVILGGMRMPLPRFGGILPASDSRGETESMNLLVGQCVVLVREIKRAEEIIDEIVQETAHILTARLELFGGASSQ